MAKSHLNLDLTKWQEQKLLENRKKRLRSELPVLTHDEIRRFRLPLHEALMGELLDRGCVNGAEYLRQLIDHNEKFRMKHMYDSILMARPILLKSEDTLELLRNGFEEAERYYNSGNISKEIDVFFDLAIFFGYTNSDDWWWLADQLFTQIIKMSTQYEEDEGFREAQAYYVYGKYLNEYKHNNEEAIEFLNMSRILSTNKPWCATKLKQITAQKLMFVETSSLLYSIWVKQINTILLDTPQRAMEFCMYAKQIVFDACLPKAEIYFLQGKCEKELGMADRAIKCFQKAYNLYQSLKNGENMCEARISLATCYLDKGDWEKTNSELNKLLDFAIKNKMPHYEALAYLYIGQFNLNQGTPEHATEFLVKAFDIFHELNDVDQREFVNNLAAVSRGQELFGNYTNLILKCEGTGKEVANNIFRMVRWKDTREPFWGDDLRSKSFISSDHIEESLEKTTFDEEPEEELHEVEEEEIKTHELSESQVNVSKKSSIVDDVEE